MKEYRYPSVLSIAGFDGSGGAGIQADIKTITALGCYATSVLTALPVQNTVGVRSVHPIPVAVVTAQLAAIMEDIPPDAIKIGMVHCAELVQTIVAALERYPKVPVIFDPVMVASSGHSLIQENTIAAFIEQLLPLVSLITPNLDEAGLLTGKPVTNIEEMYIAGERIREMGAPAVLIKGGHLPETQQITSLYFDKEGAVKVFESDKYNTDNTHGTGCTLSSAIASYVARGQPFADAVGLAQTYVQEAIYHGRDVLTGKGKGPLNHFFAPEPLIKTRLQQG